METANVFIMKSAYYCFKKNTVTALLKHEKDQNDKKQDKLYTQMRITS